MPRKKSRSPTKQTTTRLQNQQGPVGPPRFGKYGKLISRFYEHLLVLHEYDPVRGDHTHEIREPGLGGYVDDLAFLCECEKGGDACTAIGLEDSENSFIFWVAANMNPSKKITPFLQELLATLANILKMPEEDRPAQERPLLAMCTQHAKAKIKQLKRLLLLAIERCLERDKRPFLNSWLDQFKNCLGDVETCELAYKLRRTKEMDELESMGKQPTYIRSPTERKSPFAEARHYVGRLAHYVRVTQRLIPDLYLVEEFISNPFQTESAPTTPCVGSPQPDNLTTLDGICNRLVPRHQPILTQVKAELEVRNIVEKIKASYKDLKPRVHAEVQILEYFYSKKLKWAGDYKYVGCSKSACFCCQRYFRHHPAKPMEPQSHQKVWPAWGPIRLESGVNEADEDYIHQRDILNAIINDIRGELFAQIQAGRGRHPWHEDTRTDITRSDAHIEVNSVREIAVSLEAMHMNTSDSQVASGSSETDADETDSCASDVSSVSDSTQRGEVDELDSDTSSDEESNLDGGALLWKA